MHQYEKGNPLAGAVRATIQAPPSPVSVDDLAYCSQAKPNASAPPPLMRYPCTFPDMESGTLAHLTPGNEGALMVGTRISIIDQTHDDACVAGDYSCRPWLPPVEKSTEGVERTTKFVGDIEGATLMLQHSVSREDRQTIGLKNSLIDSFNPNRPVAKLQGPTGLVRRIHAPSPSTHRPLAPLAAPLRDPAHATALPNPPPHTP